MAYLTLTERGRVWNSLDDNLREKIRKGELTLEEAAEFVVPIGDIELATAREQYPTRPVVEEAPPFNPPQGEYGLDTMMEVGLASGEAAFDTVGAAANAESLAQAERVKAARGTSFADTIASRWREERKDAPAAADVGMNPYEATAFGAGLIGDAATAVAGGLMTEQQTQMWSEDRAERQAQQELMALSANVEQLEATRQYLNTLPQNPYTKEFVEKLDSGDFIGAAFAAPGAVGTTMGEQAPTLLAQLGISAGTYALTRSKAATARAAMVAGGAGGFSEIGTDYLSIIEEMPPEDRRNLTKVRQALEMAKEAAAARTAIEAMIPRGLSALGSTAVAKLGFNAAGQAISGAAGEQVAANIMGQERSAGELALEALADTAGVGTEFAAGGLRNARIEDAQDAYAKQRISDVNRQFVKELADLQARDAEVDRQSREFDAQMEADRIIRDTRDGEALQRGEQMELPIGSDMAGDPTANDRVPTIVDMFSGESRAAPNVQTELNRRVAADQMPEETDEAFEIRQQRVEQARRQIADRKATQANRAAEAEEIVSEADAEEAAAKAEADRRQIAEDQTTLKNEKSILSTADINREAKAVLEQEVERVRNQRRGIARTPQQLEAIVKAYRTKRMPELVESIRKRRLDVVNAARERALARENADVEARNEQLRAEQARLKFQNMPRDNSAERAGVSRERPWGITEGPTDALTRLLPGNMLRDAQTYTAKGDVAEREQQDLFEQESQQRALARAPKGTQSTLDLPPQAEEGQVSLFGDTNTGYTGTMTDDQRREELARRTRTTDVSRARKEEVANAQATVDEEARIQAEIPTVAKKLAEAQTKKANLTVEKYARDEEKAINKIIKEETSKENDTRTAEERTRDVARRVAAWRKDNPAPKAAPAVAELTNQASRIKESQEKRTSTKERASVRAELARAIKAGATPEEAARQVAAKRGMPIEDVVDEDDTSNRVLTAEEDAAARRELMGKLPGTEGTSAVTAPDGWGVSAAAPNEFQYLEDALDRQLQRRRPQLGPILREMSNHPTTPRAYKWLAARLAPLVDNLGVTVEPVDPDIMGTHGAIFLQNRNTVQFRNKSPTAFLHEALHAVTYNLINAPASVQTPKVKEAVKQLQAVMDAINKHLASGVDTPPSRLTHALKDIDELLAYGMTEPDIMTYMSRIPMPGKKGSVWQGFKNAIYNLFSPRTAGQFTALDAVIEATGALVEEQDANQGLNARASTARQMTTLFERNRQSRDSDRDATTAMAEPTPDFSNPTTRRDYYDLVDFSIAGKQIKAKVLKEVVRNPGKALLNALTAGAVKHATTTRALERAQSSTAALTRRADKLIEAIDGSLAKLARTTKRDPAEVRKEFTDLTEKYEQLPRGLEKKKVAREIYDKFHTAGKSYFGVRRTIDNLSRAILRERLNDPTPLTEAEYKIYSAIKANIGHYYTRVYATTISKVSDKHAKNMLSGYNKVATGKPVTEQDKKNYEIVKNGVAYIRDHLLVIPDETTLEDLSNAKLNKLASAWGISLGEGVNMDQALTSEDRRDYLIEQLTKLRGNASQARMEAQAMKLIEGMLLGAEPNSALREYYRGSKLDRTIVTEREFVPEPIRKLLGEYDDKFIRGMTTIVRQGEFLARMRMLNELRATEQGGRLQTDEEFRDGGFSMQDWTQLKGPGYGALQGMWARNDLAERIEDTQDVAMTLGKAVALMETNPQALPLQALSLGLSAWQKTAGFLKALALVYNPFNAIWNWAGGPLIMLSNGNISPKAVARAFKTAKDLIASQKQGGTHNKDIEKVIRAGITDSAFMGDIKASELEQLRQIVEDSSKTKAGAATEWTLSGLKTANRMWRETYAMADVVWKIANFYAQEEFLTQLYKAEGIDATPEQIEQAAAWRTNNTNFSYKRVPNALKATEKLGLTYIAPYMYETLRAPITSFLTGLSDVAAAGKAKTPKGRQLLFKHGTQRMLGSALALGGMQAMMYTAIKMMVGAAEKGEEEMEEWLEDLKVLLPEYKQQSEYYHVGNAKNGNPVLLELSRLDPFGPATELYATALTGDVRATWDKFSSMLIGNRFGNTVLQAALGGGSTATKLEEYEPEAYEAIVNGPGALGIDNGREVGKRIAKMIDTAMPSIITASFDPGNEAPEDVEILEHLTNYAGLKLEQVDVAKAVQFRAMDFSNVRDGTRSELYSFLETNVDATDEEILDEYTELQERETEGYEKLDKFYSGMLKLGYEPAQVLSQLKAQGITEADLAALATGSWRQGDNGVISVSGVEQNFAAGVQRRTLSPAQAERYKQNVQRLARLVDEGLITVRE
jgi:hypothetical protein